MKAKEITIQAGNGISFTISQDDWESAPCPICMQLVDDESFSKVADTLKRTIEENCIGCLYFDEVEDFIWREYENIVISTCRVFYYEDMTGEEYDEYMNSQEEKDRDRIAEIVYGRISKNLTTK